MTLLLTIYFLRSIFSLDNQEQFHVSIWDLLLYKPTAAHMLLCQTKEEHFTQPLRNSN